MPLYALLVDVKQYRSCDEACVLIKWFITDSVESRLEGDKSQHGEIQINCCSNSRELIEELQMYAYRLRK